MATSLDSIVSNLKGFFGGNRRTPDQKIEEVGSLVGRLSSPGNVPSDPRNAPPSIPMLKGQPPEKQALQPQEEPQLAQTLLPEQQPQPSLEELMAQAELEKQLQDSLLASLLLQGGLA